MKWMPTRPSRRRVAHLSAVLWGCAWLLLFPIAGCEEVPSVDDVPRQWRRCTHAEECTYYEAGCCDHCNGGKALPVRKDFKEQAEQTLSANCVSSAWLSCTGVGCYEPELRCSDGLCTVADRGQ